LRIFLRLFKIGNEDKFTEFKEQSFENKHRENILEQWLEKNSDAMIEDGKLL